MAPGGRALSVSLGAQQYSAAWPGWAAATGVELAIMDADSTGDAAKAAMASLAPFDFAFIDGSHLWEQVSVDWATVRPLVRPGGVVAFHDITPHGCMPNEQIDVPRLWEQIKAEGLQTVELVAAPGCYCGIGVVYL
jgi:predicted O-methyltransferase YrrM